MSEDGVLLVNTSKSSEEVKNETGFGGEVLTFNATKVAEEAGSGYANIPILGALVAVLGTDYDVAEAEVKKALSKKLPEEIVEMNLRAFKVGYETLS